MENNNDTMKKEDVVNNDNAMKPENAVNSADAVSNDKAMSQAERPAPRPGHKRAAAWVAAFLVVAVLFSAMSGTIVYQWMKSSAAGPARTAVSQQAESSAAEPAGTAATTTSGALTDKYFSVADAASRTDPNKKTLTVMEIAALGKPAVVAITTETSITNPFGQTGIVPAAGSGFILTADGYIVTNHHVIDGAQKISVMLDSGVSYEAKLVGSDSQNDIAVLKIAAKDLPTVTLGESTGLQVGELAVAIGNPLGELSGTVTAGIISALDRSVTIDNQTLTLLQTDAAINAGNSGGALFNSFGEVIGINTAKNTGTGIEGLGFAIPIDHAKPIIESLIRNGYIPGRPRIGIYTQDVTAEMAQQNQLREGIYVARVMASSAAEKAGLAAGDIIVAANGQEILTTDALNTLKSSLKPGDTLKLTVYRNDQKLTISVVLEEEVPAAA